MPIELTRFPADGAEMLERWLASPLVARWWKARWTAPVLEALHAGRPVPEWIHAWQVELDGRAIGYAQDCDAGRDSDAWASEDGVGPGTRAVAVLIGEPEALNRKLGREAIRALAGRLFAEPGIDRLVSAPHPDNWPAIIAFKRAGFRERGRRQFPDGPVMVLTAAKAVWKA